LLDKAGLSPLDSSSLAITVRLQYKTAFLYTEC
jgi:hypothetical protein